MCAADVTGYGSLGRHNLPAEVASFVGRERELAEIARSLGRTRLLTLTGTGGAGKTRLALRAAFAAAPGYADGVRLVQLGPLADSGMVVRAVASAAGVRGSSGRPLLAALAGALASRRMLLLLDNCEHVIGACARLAETLLQAAPHLRILATSREPLRVGGEHVWRVPPLAIPEDAQATAAALMSVEAVSLFVERAGGRRPGFALTPSNAAAVAAICRRLEGLPLAIELAAAQIAALAPEEILARLDRPAQVLTGGNRAVARQETLGAALDWSHALLGGDEQALFRRLSVFAGGFDVEAAEAVGGGDEIEAAQVLPLLVSLVEKSLIEVRRQDGRTRYRLLEPVRQYAGEQLDVSGELEGTRRRQLAHFRSLAETAEPMLMSGRRKPFMDRLALEQDNVRTALAWSRAAKDPADVEMGLRLAGALTFFWNLRGETNEGLDWLEALLAVGQDADPAVRARALWAAGELAWLCGQPALGRTCVEEAEILFRALGDKRGLAYTLQSLPMSVDHPRARDAVEESLRLFEEIGDAWGVALAIGGADVFPLLREGDPTGEGKRRLEEGLARARLVDDAWLMAQRLNFLGDFERSQGNDAAAKEHYEEALSLLRGQDLTGTVPSLLHNLGYLALRRQDTRQARSLFRRSLVLFRDQGDQRGIADCLIGLGAVLATMGPPERAAELFGAAEALRDLIGATIWPSNLPAYEQSVTAAREQMSEGEFDAAWARGRALHPEQMMAAALGEGEGRGDAEALYDSPLTAREHEVAALVARGLTNRQIGAVLFITEGTARLHVKHILQKLGFSSRAQIAAWVVEHRIAAGETSG